MKILKVFAICGKNGVLGHVTNAILYKFMSPIHIEAP